MTPPPDGDTTGGRRMLLARLDSPDATPADARAALAAGGCAGDGRRRPVAGRLAAAYDAALARWRQATPAAVRWGPLVGMLLGDPPMPGTVSRQLRTWARDADGAGPGRRRLREVLDRADRLADGVRIDRMAAELAPGAVPSVADAVAWLEATCAELAAGPDVATVLASDRIRGGGQLWATMTVAATAVRHGDGWTAWAVPAGIAANADGPLMGADAPLHDPSVAVAGRLLSDWLDTPGPDRGLERDQLWPAAARLAAVPGCQAG